MNEIADLQSQLNPRQKEILSDTIRAGGELEVINDQLKGWDFAPATREQVDTFFRVYSKDRWSRRLDLAAQEADTIMALVRQSTGQIPDAVLAALGQITFGKIASGKVEAEDLAKFTALFLRAKAPDRAERALDIQAEKARRAHRNATERALDAFARELPQNPAALEAFQQLKNQLLDQTEHLEETL